MGKFFQIIGLLFLLGIVTCVGGGYWMYHSTTDIADAGTQLLVLVRDGKVHEAYLASSPGLRSQQSEAEFAIRAARLHLADYRDVTWLDRKIENDRGHINGTVKLAGDKTINLSMDLAREAGGWKVLSVDEFKMRGEPDTKRNQGDGI